MSSSPVELPEGARKVLALANIEYPESYAVPTADQICGSIEVPPSKSVSHRYLNLALLRSQPIELERLLFAEDTALFLATLEAMGWNVDLRPRTGSLDVALTPPAQKPESSSSRPIRVECGNAGTFYRFAVASLTTCEGYFRVDGTARLRERPIGALVDCLRELGASIEYLEREGFAPLLIEGGTLAGGKATLDASESSQYLSAVLMAGSRAAGTIEIDVVGLSSAPYINITLEALREFGLGDSSSVELPETGVGPGRFRIFPRSSRSDSSMKRLRVEGDYSAAAYPAAAVALAGGRVELEGLRRDSSQGDRRLLELLERMGATLEWRSTADSGAGEVLVVGGDGSLRPLGSVDMGDIPDQVPTVATLSVFASGRTEIVGVPHLRIKESDRLYAMASQLTRIGARIEERGDDLVIEGGTDWCDLKRLRESSEVRINSFNDHRIAMSMALAGLRRPGVVVLMPEVVAKSYPRFWFDLESLIHAQTDRNATIEDDSLP